MNEHTATSIHRPNAGWEINNGMMEFYILWDAPMKARCVVRSRPRLGQQQ
jgi:hypothetical protein